MTRELTDRTRVKICGITRPEDGVIAARMGADAIGLVFYPPSPRSVSIEQAAAVIAAMPPFITKVALFVDATSSEVENVLQALSIDLLQFHGNEAPEFCNSFGRAYIKAVRMKEGIELLDIAERYRDASGLLLDSYEKGIPGGTGNAFDWARVPEGLDTPVILAGGLGPDNVAQAIEQAAPYAVDVSSGVEASKGIKERAKIAAFMRGVEKADGKRK